MMRKFHCEKCGVEKELEELRISQEGIHLRKCPKCGQLMAPGALPPPPPDQKELTKLRQALEAVREAISAQRPDTIAAERRKLAELRDEIAKLEAQAPTGDVAAIFADVTAEADRLASELRERQNRLTMLKAQEEELTAKLRTLEAADRYHREKALEERLSQPWPGEEELVAALKKWRAKHEKAFTEAVEAFDKEARSLGWLPSRRPPSLHELLVRAWHKAQG